MVYPHLRKQMRQAIDAEYDRSPAEKFRKVCAELPAALSTQWDLDRRYKKELACLRQTPVTRGGSVHLAGEGPHALGVTREPGSQRSLRRTEPPDLREARRAICLGDFPEGLLDPAHQRTSLSWRSCASSSADELQG